MNQFTSCFVGIPLPEKFQKEFEGLLKDINSLYPKWKTVYPKTPHITVYYLDKQSQHVLPSVVGIIQTKINILKNLVLTIKGFNYFTKENLREDIVFLDIIYPHPFADFNQILKIELNQYYSADNNLPFHPHITVARVKGLKDVSNIENKIYKPNWKFPVTEIALYGVDSTKQPQHQEKLVSIPVK